MEILIAIGSINAFFFSLVIFGKRSSTKADKLLAIMFVVLGFSFGFVYLSFILKLPILQLFIWNMGLLIAPLLYLYGYLLLNRNVELKKTCLINFIPYLISWIYFVIVYVTYSETEIRTLFISGLKNTNILFVFFTIIETASIPFYIFLIVRLLRKTEFRNLGSVQPSPESAKLSFRRSNAKYERCNWRNLLGKYLSLGGGLRFQLSSLKSSGRKDSKSKLHNDITLVWLRVLTIGILLIWLLINGFYYLVPLSDEMSLKYGFGLSSIIIFYLGYFVQSKLHIASPSSKSLSC